MADENFVKKFDQLWMESKPGVALVTLQAHIPGFQKDLRHNQEDSSHGYHHHPRGDPRHRRKYPRPKRAAPSRVRRCVGREQARAELMKSAEQAATAVVDYSIPTYPPP